jgi:response regulator of citrate/malate metabolism
MKVLIIEDNYFKISLIQWYIKSFVESSIIVFSLYEALPYLESQQFNYIFLDHHLPDGKGSDYIDRFKHLQQNTQYISISNDSTIIQNYRNLGYNDIFQPPFEKTAERIFKNNFVFHE